MDQVIKELIQVTVVEIIVKSLVVQVELLMLVQVLYQVEQVLLLVVRALLELEVLVVAEVVHNHNLQAPQVVMVNLIIEL